MSLESLFPSCSLFPVYCSLPHSTRSATIGFSLDARVAGSQTASNATAARISGTDTNTAGSQDFTPNRKLAMKRVSQNAAPIPSTRPTSARRMPCQTTSLRIVRAIGAQRHANAHLLRALLHGVRHQAVDPDRRQHQRDHAEDRQQHHVEVLARGGARERSRPSTTRATGKPPLAWRSCSVIWLISWRGSPCVRTTHRSGTMPAFSLVMPSVTCASGTIISAPGSLAQPAVVRVAHHADDLARRLFKVGPHAVSDHDLLADRILLREELLRQRLIDRWPPAGAPAVSWSVNSRPRTTGIWKSL